MAASDHPIAADPGGSGDPQAAQAAPTDPAAPEKAPAEPSAAAPESPPEPPPEPEDLAEYDEILFARTLLLAAPIGIMAINNEGQFIFFNEPIKKMFGFPEELVLKRSSLALFSYLRDQFIDADSLWSVVQDIRDGRLESWHGSLTLRNGSIFEITVRLLRSERGVLGRLWLVRDVTEQLRSQEALKASEANLRTVVQEQERLIATIREIGTPVLPIYNRVLVLPLVGHIETTRSTHIMDALLEAIQNHQASVVIIDITGVSLVDTSVANSLIQSMQAATLIGAHCVLVGISAAVSRTIVHLGVDLSQVTTRRDLQAGFAFALNYLGCAITITREEPDWLSELDPSEGGAET